MRLFAAAFLPEEAKDAALGWARTLRDSVRGARWEPGEKLHATLGFLGDVDPSRIPGISADIGSAVRGSGLVSTGFSGVRLFPDPKRPRVIALELSAGGGFLPLFGRVREALARNGFGAEKRKFVPHVTVGRIRGDFSDAGKIVPPAETRFLVSEAGLVLSELGPGGSRYTALETWDLRAGI